MKCTPQSTSFSCRSASCFLSYLSFVCVIFLIIGCSSPKKNIQSSSVSGTFVETKVQSAKDVSGEKLDKYKRALSKMQNGDYKKAALLLREVSDVYPSLSGPYINMGIIALKQNDYIKAENNFKVAIRIKPNNAEVYNFLGVVYRQQGRFPDASKAYKKALSLDKNMAKSYLNLGILNDLYLGDFEEAKKNYKKYQQLSAVQTSANNPDDKKVNTWLADLNVRMQASSQ